MKILSEIFSPKEQRILKLIGTKRMKIQDLTKRFHNHRKPPYDANNIVGACLRRINTKCEYHDLEWFIDGENHGRLGKTIWKEKR